MPKDNQKKKYTQEWQQTHPFNVMCRCARSHDKRYEYNDSEYITPDFLEAEYNKQGGLCFYCDDKMIYGIGVNRKTTPNAVSVERILNELPHLKNNIVMACMKCNGIRGRYTPFEVMVEFAKEIKRCELKYCRTCDETKPTNEFHVGHDKLLGHKFACKKCRSVSSSVTRHTKGIKYNKKKLRYHKKELKIAQYKYANL
jgi:hypothetical protein